MYSMLGFIYFFKNKQNNNYVYILYIILLSLFLISSLSPYVINNMLYDDIKKIYYEDYGFLYYIYLFLYLLFIPLFSIFSYLKLKQIRTLDKLRIKFISI